MASLPTAHTKDWYDCEEVTECGQSQEPLVEAVVVTKSAVVPAVPREDLPVLRPVGDVARPKNPRDDRGRETFRKYLEHEGVTDFITKALAPLEGLKEKPDDPIAFLKSYLQSTAMDPVAYEYQALEQEEKEVQGRLQKLEKDIEQLEKSFRSTVT